MKMKFVRAFMSLVVALALGMGLAVASDSAKKVFLQKTDFRTNNPEVDDWVRNLVELQSKTLFTTYGGMTVVKDKKEADCILAIRIVKQNGNNKWKMNGTLTATSDKSENQYKSDIVGVDEIASGEATDVMVYTLLSEYGISKDVLEPINKGSSSYIRNITASLAPDSEGLTFWRVPVASSLSETDDKMLFEGNERLSVERTSFAVNPDGTLFVTRAYKKDNSAARMGLGVLSAVTTGVTVATTGIYADTGNIPYEMKMATFTFVNDKMVSATYVTVPETKAYDYMTEIVNTGTVSQSKQDSTGSLDVYYNKKGDKVSYDYSSKTVEAYIRNYADIPAYTPPPEEENWDGKELDFMGLKFGSSVADAEKAVKVDGWKNSKKFPDAVQTVSLADGSAMTTLTKYYVDGKWRALKMTAISLVFKNGKLFSVVLLPKLTSSQSLKSIADGMVEEYDLHEVTAFVSGGDRYATDSQDKKTYRDCVGNRLISYKDKSQGTYIVSYEFYDKEAEAKKKAAESKVNDVASMQKEIEELRRENEELKKQLKKLQGKQ